MLSQDLLGQVKSLANEDKVKPFWILRGDPALAETAPEITGLRYNYRAAQILLEMSEKSKAESQRETE